MLQTHRLVAAEMCRRRRHANTFGVAKFQWNWQTERNLSGAHIPDEVKWRLKIDWMVDRGRVFAFHSMHINFMENRNRNACFLRLVLLGFPFRFRLFDVYARAIYRPNFYVRTTCYVALVRVPCGVLWVWLCGGECRRVLRVRAVSSRNRLLMDYVCVCVCVRRWLRVDGIMYKGERGYRTLFGYAVRVPHDWAIEMLTKSINCTQLKLRICTIEMAIVCAPSQNN